MTTPFDFWLAYWSALASAAPPARTTVQERTGVVLDYRTFRVTQRKWVEVEQETDAHGA